ncbi:MAG TPA: chloride channel protein [Gemmatimonadales bacterium]|nr:chloride channel protein [Gemmatimonadales bacterium]
MAVRGDFTADRRLLALSVLGIGIGGLCAFLAAALLRLIALFTNLFFFQRLSFADARPAAHTLGPWAIVVPVIGGLIIGLMARFGSEKIRGHGIPEALEAILIGRSRMEPKLAVLKPLSSAISIGSGGPFGAEGPIIMTGGAVGSLIAQTFQFSAAERKTLLVAGAAGGMSATFATPVAAVLLAVELLLFEWKPRSFIPVALASATAAALRPMLLGHGPLFPLPAHAHIDGAGLAACVGVGVACGVLSALLTRAVYAAEDAFQRLPVHWMWWPALGGLAVGIGGLIEPRALGVGYDVIGDLVRGAMPAGPMVRLLVVKAVIWSIALGSGTSGGVLAPLLMMGAAAGLLLAPILPAGGAAWWPLVGLSAILSGTMRCPLTAVVFALELTQQVDALLPLLIACAAAYAVTVLVMPRSILTEKVARRGHHLSREYSVDPLETLLVSQVMSHPVQTVQATLPVAELEARHFDPRLGRHQGYPVVTASGRLVGVVTRSELLDLPPPEELGRIVVASLLGREPVVAHPDESCRAVAERMAKEGVGRLPVVSDKAPHAVIGIVTRSDLLKARERQLEIEQRRENLIRLPAPELWRPFSRE